MGSVMERREDFFLLIDLRKSVNAGDSSDSINVVGITNSEFSGSINFNCSFQYFQYKLKTDHSKNVLSEKRWQTVNRGH
jgi:hypothetical protein